MHDTKKAQRPVHFQGIKHSVTAAVGYLGVTQKACNTVFPLDIIKLGCYENTREAVVRWC